VLDLEQPPIPQSGTPQFIHDIEGSVSLDSNNYFVEASFDDPGGTAEFFLTDSLSYDIEDSFYSLQAKIFDSPAAGISGTARGFLTVYGSSLNFGINDPTILVTADIDFGVIEVDEGGGLEGDPPSTALIGFRTTNIQCISEIDIFANCTDSESVYLDVAFIDDLNIDDFTAFKGSAVTTIPVPAAAWLFGSGLLGMVSFARRRKV